jgi:hypothetical protein
MKRRLLSGGIFFWCGLRKENVGALVDSIGLALEWGSAACVSHVNSGVMWAWDECGHGRPEGGG